MSSGAAPTDIRLNDLLVSAGMEPVNRLLEGRFGLYYSLLLRWNARLNLTAIREKPKILARHFAESIFCARALPQGIATLLDFGSGAGFPGVPIALCRPEITVTLAESQGKKAAFLHEVVRALGISATVYFGRAESLSEEFDCVAMRAVDRMHEAVRAGSRQVRRGGWIALMTTGDDIEGLKVAAGSGFSWPKVEALPGSARGLLALGLRCSR